MPKDSVTPPESPADRRSNPRLRLDLPLAVPVHIRSDLGAHRGVARNISEGGMLVELEETPPIGSEVEVTIASLLGKREAQDTFTWRAEVRHQVAWSFIERAGHRQLRGVGLRFLCAVSQGPVGGWLH